MDSRPPSPQTLELARARLDRALLGRPDDVRLLLLRARADERTGRYAEAAGFFERAAILLQRDGESMEEAGALVDCAKALSRAGFDAEAVSTYRQAVQRYYAIEATHDTADALLAWARHELAHRRLDSARERLEAARPSLVERQDFAQLGWALDRLVEVYRAVHATEHALGVAREAVKVAAQDRDSRAFGLRLATFGQLHLEAGHPAKARTYLDKALPYLREGVRHGQLLQALLALTELAEIRGDGRASVTHLEEALGVVDLGGPLDKQAQVRCTLADKLCVEDPSRARALLAEAVTLYREAGDPQSSAPAWMQLAELQHQLGEHDEARTSQARARELYAMVGDRRGAARAAVPFEDLV